MAWTVGSAHSDFMEKNNAVLRSLKNDGGDQSPDCTSVCLNAVNLGGGELGEKIGDILKKKIENGERTNKLWQI